MTRQDQANSTAGKSDKMLVKMREYHAKYGVWPTTRELADMYHTSTSVINYYLENLRERKIIEFPGLPGSEGKKRGARNIRIRGLARVTAVYCETCREVWPSPGKVTCGHETLRLAEFQEV